MAKNKGSRVGEVRGRTQAYSPQNKRWTKKGKDGKFMDQYAKRDAAFKGVHKVGNKRYRRHTKGH